MAPSPPIDDKEDDKSNAAAAASLTPGENVLEEEHVTANGDLKTISSSSKKKSPKTSTAKKTPNKSSPNASTTPGSKKKPTMTEMVHQAICSLGDRTGSSGTAIRKHILDTHDHVQDNKAFRSRLNLTLKTGVKNERFKKNRNSYKIHAAFCKKERERKKKQSKKLNEQEKKKQQEMEKIAAEKKQKELEAKMTPEQLAVLQKKQQKEREIRRKKELEEKAAKERQERIRKRRFPMEDTKLHREDKELHVKPPPEVTRRPALPYFFHATLPLDDPRRSGKIPASITGPSKCDLLEYDSRGLVPDLLQVYHFFRGDVHFTLDEDTQLVPEFGLDHLMFAVEQVMNGNARRSRLVPPLISHLFCTCLKLLTSSTTFVVDDETAHERRLRLDLDKLAAALSPSSWGEVCALYMDAMERYFTTSASLDSSVLPSGKIDVAYLMRATDVAEPMTPAVTRKHATDEDAVAPLPDGYQGYLGNPHGTLAVAQAKLMRQDSWNLKADELMALLRALTDDILATSPEIAHDLAKRYVAVS